MLRFGDSGPEVVDLQFKLRDNGADIKADGIFGADTLDAVEAFQEEHDLLADGIVGPATIRALMVVENSEPWPSEAPWRRMSVDRVRLTPLNGGFASTRLRSDAAVSMAELQAECLALGGVGVTSAGGLRGLHAGGGAAQSRSSLHYCGLAHDLALPTTYRTEKNAPYLMVPMFDLADTSPSTRRRWQIFAVVPADHPITDARLECRTVNAVGAATIAGKLVLTQTPVHARVFDFTGLAQQHGWEFITSRRSAFRRAKRIDATTVQTDGTFTALEGWHMQYERALTAAGDASGSPPSTFGGELMKIYTPDQVKRLPWWDDVRDLEWQRNWW